MLPFWKELQAAREEGRPACWREPFGAPAVATGEIFDWLVDAWRGGSVEKGGRMRLYGASGVVGHAPDHAPAAGDGSMRGWLRRLEQTHGECGVVINDLQAASLGAWRRAQALLGAIHDSLGVPPAGASFEVFAGAYRRGAFGVHKDDQDVITFVTEGRKRFRLWPYERFAGRAEVPAGSQLKQVGLTLAAGEELDGSIVVEGEPGDVFFWPAEWWHVAESDGEMCTSVGVGLFRGKPPVIADEERREELELAAASALGCKMTPPPREDPVPDGRLQLAGCVPWRLSGEDTVVWAVGGEAFRYPAAPAIVALLERVTGGAPFVAVDLCEELADEEVAPDALEHIVGLLHAYHALSA